MHRTQGVLLKPAKRPDSRGYTDSLHGAIENHEGQPRARSVADKARGRVAVSV